MRVAKKCTAWRHCRRQKLSNKEIAAALGTTEGAHEGAVAGSKLGAVVGRSLGISDGESDGLLVGV